MRKILIFLGVLVIAVVMVTLTMFIFFKTYPGSTLEECDKAAQKFSDKEAEEIKYICYSLVAEEKEDVAICEKIPENRYELEYEKYTCYGNLAFKKENLSICNNLESNLKFLSSITKKNFCYDQVISRCDMEESIKKLLSPDEDYSPSKICEILKETDYYKKHREIEKEIEKSFFDDPFYRE